METTKGITAKIAENLHAKVKLEQEEKDLTVNDYLTMVLEHLGHSIFI